VFRNADLTWTGLFLQGDCGNTGVMLSQIFTNFHLELLPSIIAAYWQVLALIALGYVLHMIPSQWCKSAFVELPAFLYVIILAFLIVIIIQVKTSDIQPFIYFQF